MIAPPLRFVLRALLLAGVLTTLLSCGGRAPPNTLTESAPIDVVVSVAGMPVQGLVVDVVALDDATGQPSTRRVAGSVLASSVPTDADGRTRLVVKDAQGVWPGGVLLRARPGDAVASYTDVLTRAVAQVPHSFEFTTLVPEPFALWAPEGLQRPLTLLTTLADAHAQALAAGRHPDAPGQRRLADVLEAADARFTAHVNGKSAVGGGAWDLRTTAPARMDVPHEKLHDAIYAALVDVALVQLAEQLEASTGQGDQSFSVFGLVQLLMEDLTADARFDGRGRGGAPLATNAAAGVEPYRLDADTTRLKLAQALDAFIVSLANRTRLNRADLDANSIYRSMSDDTDALLYPLEAVPAGFKIADAIDTTPPVLEVTTPLPQALEEAVYLGPAHLEKVASTSEAPQGTPHWAFVVAGTWTDLQPDGSPGTGLTRVVVLDGRREVGRGRVERSEQGRGTWSARVELPEGTYSDLAVFGFDDGVSVTNQSSPNMSEEEKVLPKIVVDVTAPEIGPALQIGSPDRTAEQGKVCSEQAFTLNNPLGEIPLEGFSPTTPWPALTDCYWIGPHADQLQRSTTFKLATRLQPGPVHARELEEANAQNVAFVKVSAFHGVGAPHAAIELTARCSAGCASAAEEGTLKPLESVHDEAGAESFLLPLTLQSVPALNKVTDAEGRATLTIQAQATDKAGNVSTLLSFDVMLVVLAPPVRVFDDPTWGNADVYGVKTLTLSATPAEKTQRPYAEFITPGDIRIRLRRLVVSNPWAEDVLVAVANASTAPGSFELKEKWEGARKDGVVPARVYDNPQYLKRCEEVPEDSPHHFPCNRDLFERPVVFRYGKGVGDVQCVPSAQLPGNADAGVRHLTVQLKTDAFSAQPFVKGAVDQETTPASNAAGPTLGTLPTFRVKAGGQLTLFVTVPRSLRTGEPSSTLPPLEVADGLYKARWADFWETPVGDSMPSCSYQLGSATYEVYMTRYRGDAWWLRLQSLGYTARWDYAVQSLALAPDGAPSGKRGVSYASAILDAREMTLAAP